MCPAEYRWVRPMGAPNLSNASQSFGKALPEIKLLTTFPPLTSLTPVLFILASPARRMHGRTPPNKKGETRADKQRSSVSGKCLPRSGGIAASGRHAEEVDDLDEEEETDLFLFFPSRFLLPPFLLLLL